MYNSDKDEEEEEENYFLRTELGKEPKYLLGSPLPIPTQKITGVKSNVNNKGKQQQLLYSSIHK